MSLATQATLPLILGDAPVPDAALTYLEAGFHPIPVCRPEPGSPSGCNCEWHRLFRDHAAKGVGKTPLLRASRPDGRPGPGLLKVAETEGVTTDEVRTMPWGGSNLGLCLRPSGLAVLDLDGAPAAAEAVRLGLPYTTMVRRGDHHAHCYYRLPDGVPATRAIRQGDCGRIDVLAAGYVIAPPSLHATGTYYRMVSQRPFAPLPVWAVRMLEGATLHRPPQAPAVPAPTLKPDEILDQLARKHVPLWVIDRIRGGDRAGDRSRTDWSVTRALVEHGVPDGVIAAIYRNPGWRLGAKYRERSDPDGYLGAMLARHRCAALPERQP